MARKVGDACGIRAAKPTLAVDSTRPGADSLPSKSLSEGPREQEIHCFLFRKEPKPSFRRFVPFLRPIGRYVSDATKR